MYREDRFSIMQPNYSSVVQHEQILILQNYKIASHKLMKNWFGLLESESLRWRFEGVHISSVAPGQNVAVVLHTLHAILHVS